MSEIDKLYKNAGIEPDINYICDIEPPCEECLLYGCEEGSRSYDRIEGYPEFTAEKQIELIKWLSDTDYYIHNIYKTIDTKEYCIENDFYDIQTNKFEETLARLVNKLWQSLSEEEKQQVKGILE